LPNVSAPLSLKKTFHYDATFSQINLNGQYLKAKQKQSFSPQANFGETQAFKYKKRKPEQKRQKQKESKRKSKRKSKDKLFIAK
jgi:hypothetical protein